MSKMIETTLKLRDGSMAPCDVVDLTVKIRRIVAEAINFCRVNPSQSDLVTSNDIDIQVIYLKANEDYQKHFIVLSVMAGEDVWQHEYPVALKIEKLLKNEIPQNSTASVSVVLFRGSFLIVGGTKPKT